MRRRTRHNISPEFILSNHFEQKICFFLQKSCPTRKRVGAGVYAGNVMATAVCETAGARRLLMDLMDRMDLMDKMGAPRDNPRVCGAQFGVARVIDVPGVARAVWQRRCAGCGGVTLVSDLSDLSDLSDKLVRHGIPRGLAVPRWGGTQGADLPQGYALLDSNGGVQSAGRGACMGNFGNFWEFLRGVWVRHCIPHGFACQCGGGARAKNVPGVMQAVFNGNSGLRGA